MQSNALQWPGLKVGNAPAPKGARKNLVIVRAGRGSLHPTWLVGPGEAEFDLFVAPYHADAPGGPDATSTVFIPGRKISGYWELFKRRPELIDGYEYIALFDDDLLTTKQDIARLFAIGRQYQLDLFQPTLSWDSHFSYAATLTSGRYRLRYTNAVEMMCPVFTREHLKRALPLLALGYEQGIDLLWTRITDEPWFRYAMIDAVVVKHTRPVGSTKVMHVTGPNGAYDAEIPLVLSRFGAEFRGFVSYAAIDRDGRAVLSRLAIGLRSFAICGAWRTTPMPRRVFARLVTDYTRHCLTRPINLHKVSLDDGDSFSACEGPAS